jgi:hypothetical protein
MMRVRPRGPAGFTLMETLVMLVLVSFAVVLMFQMLGTYRIARERFVAQSGHVDRQALFDAWFADSVHGLFPDEDERFQGDARRFAGTTLNPLYASPGAPVAVEWSLDRSVDGEWTIAYAEGGQPRWVLPVADARDARFVYLDAAGAEQERWPPPQGMQVALPGAVALVRDTASGERARIASVRGPLEARTDPFRLEDD